MARQVFIVFIFYIANFGKAQDLIYFKTGEKQVGKIQEINSDFILFEDTFNNLNEIPKADLLVIQFKNNTTEVLNLPEKSEIIYQGKRREDLSLNNSISTNLAAFALGDLNLSFERRNIYKDVDAGIFCAYNINNRITFFNTRFTNLSSSKRNVEFGAYVNFKFQSDRPEKNRTPFVGLTYKRTLFNYSPITTSGTSSILQYTNKSTYSNVYIISYGLCSKTFNQFFISGSFGFGIATFTDEFLEDTNARSKRNNTFRGQITILIGYTF